MRWLPSPSAAIWAIRPCCAPLSSRYTISRLRSGARNRASLGESSNLISRATGSSSSISIRLVSVAATAGWLRGATYPDSIITELNGLIERPNRKWGRVFRGPHATA
jgi:hypothetical protein